MGSNVTANWRATAKAPTGNPCTQIHPTCIPRFSGDHQSKLTLMSESRSTQRRHLIGSPRPGGDCEKPAEIPRRTATITSSASIPSFGNLCPRDRLPPPNMCDEAAASARWSDRGVYLDFAMRSNAWATTAVGGERYGNLFGHVRARSRARTLPDADAHLSGPHYTMGGLWVDYDLMSTIPGLFALGEANFSDHGANRLGASGVDTGSGRRLLRDPLTTGEYAADEISAQSAIATSHPLSKRPRRKYATASNAS